MKQWIQAGGINYEIEFAVGKDTNVWWYVGEPPLVKKTYCVFPMTASFTEICNTLEARAWENVRDGYYLTQFDRDLLAKYPIKK